MTRNKIQRIEEYVKQILVGEVAHDFNHVDRVRCWAVQIASKEGCKDMDILEAAALLHDIGLPFTEERNRHGQVGAKVTTKFLEETELFPEEDIRKIANAIRYHTSMSGRGKVLQILKDADILDMLGAVGIMRAFTSKSSKPEYNPHNVKGDTWQITAREIDKRFAEGIGVGDYIVDQINFQISCHEDLNTETAKQFAKPLVVFMKAYLVQLDFEINAGQTGEVLEILCS